MTDRASAEGLREALEITADALDAAAEDAHAGWAYYGGAPGPESPHSGPDDFNKCEDSQCRRRQRYVEDARAALRDHSDSATPDRADLQTEFDNLEAEVAAESDETLLSDAEVQTIYAAFDKVNATEARTVEGRRAIVTPLYRAVIQARIDTARDLATPDRADPPVVEVEGKDGVSHRPAPTLKRLTPHEMAVLQAWTNGIGRESRELVERLIAENERARFALDEIAVHLEGLQHVRKLSTAEQAVLGQAREGLR